MSKHADADADAGVNTALAVGSTVDANVILGSFLVQILESGRSE